jgi:exopolysaccharide biosynthesis polyprenyl glycosylphosphotransferase
MSSGRDVYLPYEADSVYPDVREVTLAAVADGSGLPVSRAVTAVSEKAGPRRTWLSRLMLVHGDLFALLFAYFAAERLFAGSGVSPGGLSTAGGLFILTLPLWILAMRAAHLYARDDEVIHHTTLDEVPRLLQVATLGTWAFLVTGWLVSISTPGMGQLIGFWLLASLLLPGVRLIARSEFQRDPDFPQNTVIVGAGTVGQLLGRKILKHGEYHVRLLGFVDALPKERRDDLDDLNILGAPEQLPQLIDELGVERVIIAFSNDSHEETMDLIRLLEERDVRVDLVPRLFDILPPRLTNQTIEGIPLVTLPQLRLTRSSRFVKRTFDLVLSVVGLAVLSPLIALVALAIKLDSRGPVFFRQRRMGEGDRPFGMFKFRTMDADADLRKRELAHLNKHTRPGGDPRMFKIKADPRVTHVGRFLRRYSIDELPQLINVVIGNMSLIGPRPLILEEDEHIEAWGRKRLLLKPGITGLWQVLGRSSIPFEEMVKLDYLYITTWSLANDCRLLLQTIPEVFRGEPEGSY